MSLLIITLKEFIHSYYRLKVDSKDLTGRTALITGGNDGVGLYTAIHLAKMNCNVIIASRNKSKSEAAVEKIKKESGNKNVKYRLLDLGSIAGVKQFCDDFKKDYNSLDLLINNAGAIFYTYAKTEDGFEKTFHVNHLGPYILTLNLLPVIERGHNPRIVNLSSLAQHFSDLKLPEDLKKSSKDYNYWDAYSKSKLMNVLFTKELSKRLADKNIIVAAVHPGFVKSGLNSSDISNPFKRFFTGLLMYPIYFFLARNGEQGAMTTVYTAIDDRVVTGEYYDSCQVATIHPQGHDTKLAKALWDQSADLTNIDPNTI